MKLEETESAVTIQPARKAQAAVIWLHGLGADGHDFVPIVPSLGLPADHAVRFIFPNAPIRPVTLNGGMRMRAWYDIKSLDRSGIQDEAGTRASEATVRDLIAGERAAGIAADHIVVAGFSQGGAVALHTALRYPDRLAGLLALSTYLPLADKLPKEASAANRDLPILMCHGEYDSVLPIALAQSSREQLAALKYDVEWHAYPMAHEVCVEEIAVIGAWLRKHLSI